MLHPQISSQKCKCSEDRNTKTNKKKYTEMGHWATNRFFFGHEPLSRSERMDRQTDRHISSCHAFCHVYQLFSCFLSCISAAVMFLSCISAAVMLFVMHISCCHAACHACLHLKLFLPWLLSRSAQKHKKSK